MTRSPGSAAAPSGAPESAELLQAENTALRARLRQAQDALRLASQALAEAQLALARASDV